MSDWCPWLAERERLGPLARPLVSVDPELLWIISSEHCFPRPPLVGLVQSDCPRSRYVCDECAPVSSVQRGKLKHEARSGNAFSMRSGRDLVPWLAEARETGCPRLAY